MGGYWLRHRFLPSMILALVVAGVTSLLFVFPNIEQKADAYNEQSIYKNSDMDFIAPEPSFNQISSLPGTEGIDKVFPFYLTRTGVEVNSKTRTTTVLLSDHFENVDVTMYNSNRRIDEYKGQVENPVYVDWKFCEETSAKIGDSISFSLNGNKVEYIIKAIYETNNIYDGGAILVEISKDQKEMIAANANSNGYSAMYVSASDYAACKSYLTGDYRPLGRLRDRSEFESDEQYNVHYDAIMSSGYANEITDFRTRENGLKSKDNLVFIIVGALITAMAIIAFNIFMAKRGSEEGYFANNCIPKGIDVKPYYKRTFLFEMISFIVFFTVIMVIRIKLSTDFIPRNAIGINVLLIPVIGIFAESISFFMNNHKVSLLVKKARKNKD